MDIYESFFMKEVSRMMDRSDMDVSVTEEIKIRVVKWAKASVLKLSDGEPIFFWREALGLMLKGEFEIPSEKLLSLLCLAVIQFPERILMNIIAVSIPCLNI